MSFLLFRALKQFVTMGQRRRQRRQGGRQRPGRAPLPASTGVYALEALEGRVLLSATLVSDLPDLTLQQNGSAVAIDVSASFDDAAITGTVIEFTTNLGNFKVELFDTAKPLTVANFLRYMEDTVIVSGKPVVRHRYDNSIIHRGAANFVIQGGGATISGVDLTAIATDAPVLNEPGDNIRGTIALAKQGGDPNSGTSQFFFNLVDNTTTLGPSNNGGFTPFGRVLGPGMTVVDAMAALSVYNIAASYPNLAGSSVGLSTVPIQNLVNNQITGEDNFVVIRQVARAAELTFSATTDNPELIHVAVAGDLVTVHLLAGAVGTGNVTVRATDVDGTFVENTFAVEAQAVAAPPAVASLKAAPPKVITAAQKLRLIAVKPTAASGRTISAVEFFRDSNGNGELDPGIDERVGLDQSRLGGWSALIPTDGFGYQDTRFFARAQDDSGAGSDPVSVLVSFINKAPTLTKLGSLSGLTRNQAGNVSFSVIDLVSNAADVNRDDVIFRIEAVLSGALSKGGEPVVPGVTTLGPGEILSWTPPTDQEGLLSAFSIRAYDGVLLSAKALPLKITVNTVPTIGALTSSGPVIRGDRLTLTASQVTDLAPGKIVQVEFFRDANGNGVLDNGDQALALGRRDRDGTTYTLSTTSTKLSVGNNTFFARAVDNLGGATLRSVVVVATNRDPTLSKLVVSPNRAAPGATVSLSAAGPRDLDGAIAKVEFYRDDDGDGVITSADTKLGEDLSAVGGWRLAWTVPTDAVAGPITVLARAVDNNGGLSLARLATLTVL